MIIVTPGEMNHIDKTAIQKLGIPGIVLMENAAKCVTLQVVKQLVTLAQKKVMIFAGKGNNGGDAFAVARQLYLLGAIVKVIVLAKKDDIKGDAKTNLDILDNMGVPIDVVLDEAHLVSATHETDQMDMIVDGILGTGLSGSLSSFMLKCIEIINHSKCYVLSIDIPSGVDGLTGFITDHAVKANQTVTFQFPKAGLLNYPGKDYVGELTISSIGIPCEAYEDLDIKLNLLEEVYIKTLMPKRKRDGHKGDFGRVLIIGGSEGMLGAMALCGEAALRTGSGLVYLCVPRDCIHSMDMMVLETLTIPMDKESLKGEIKNFDAIAIGPGLKPSDENMDLVKWVMENAKVPLVMDAGALAILSKNKHLLENVKMPLVITPHAGEMSRIIGRSAREIQLQRVMLSSEFSTKHKIITVLKGSMTVIALPDGKVYINPTGNPGMATAGSGDVLTGMIVSLLGQGMPTKDAALFGVYLHGLSGDIGAKIIGEAGLIASDILKMVPRAMRCLNEKGAQHGI